MPEINLVVHGRTYGVGCDEGQERRVRELGQYIDKRVREIAAAGGTAPEAHLLVLTALVMADELFEARENANTLRTELQRQAHAIDDLEERLTAPAENRTEPPTREQGLDPDLESQIVNAIDTLAGRLDSIAKKLKAA